MTHTDTASEPRQIRAGVITLSILAWMYGSGVSPAHAATLQAITSSVSVVRAGSVLPAVNGMRLPHGEALVPAEGLFKPSSLDQLMQ